MEVNVREAVAAKEVPERVLERKVPLLVLYWVTARQPKSHGRGTLLLARLARLLGSGCGGGGGGCGLWGVSLLLSSAGAGHRGPPTLVSPTRAGACHNTAEKARSPGGGAEQRSLRRSLRLRRSAVCRRQAILDALDDAQRVGIRGASGTSFNSGGALHRIDQVLWGGKIIGKQPPKGKSQRGSACEGRLGSCARSSNENETRDGS